jgi:glutathione S-transferase
MLHLQYYPSTASMVPHILLEELGVPYQRVLVDRAVNAHKSPAVPAAQPERPDPCSDAGRCGRVRSLVLYETAAIVLHLCDTHPDAGLAPPVGSAERAHFYKWLIWLTNTLQATLIVYFYPERWVTRGQRRRRGRGEGGRRERRSPACWTSLTANSRSHGQVWFMGAALQRRWMPYVFTLCRWTRNFASAPARGRAHLGPYLQRMLARPAVQRVMVAEQLQPPFV